MGIPGLDEAAIFDVARQLPATDVRQKYMLQACAGDDALLARVEALLQVHDSERGFLESPAVRCVSDLGSHGGDEVGRKIGSYKLVEKIGEGGFGVVYLAEQQQQLRRKVALKILKPGMETSQVVARFEAERQALALMDHDNIARVLDGGETASGRPFFVMELVKGIPITQFCDEQKLTPRERLSLLVPVCQAVQHAHQKGIIHRDLKPGNVLIASYDGKPVPKVIDFGVAKALGHQLTDRTLVTNFGGILGTLDYMSPEQAEFNARDVDTRADVYSLGVLLYELLVGTTPLTREQLKSTAVSEVLRLIREEDPPKPSTRLSDLKDSLASISAQRRLEPSRLTREIRGELDWIVMKCLEKDRDRRYAAANSLARDLERYLNNEPVEAGPPSATYRLRKLVRRHRGAVTAALIVVASLLVGVVVASAGWLEATRQEHLAEEAHLAEARARTRESDRADAEAQARQRATQAETRATKQKQDAENNLAIAQGVAEFLLDDLLGQGGAASQIERQYKPNPNLTIREALDRASVAIGRRFQDRPEVEVPIRMTIGNAYRELGLFDQAVSQLKAAVVLREKSLGRETLETGRSLHDLAYALREAGNYSEAIPLYEEVRDLQFRLLGPDHPLTHTTLQNLGVAYRDAGRLAEAVAIHRQVYEARVRILGPESPLTLKTLHNLATETMDAGDTAQAVVLYEQIRGVWAKQHHLESIEAAHTLNNLARAYWLLKRLDKSIPLFEQVVATQVKIQGEHHRETLRAMANLGVNYRDANRLPEAIRLMEKAHREGRDYPELAWAPFVLATAYNRAGRFADATALAKEIVATARRTADPESPKLAVALHRAGTVFIDAQAWTEAETVLKECLAIRQRLKDETWTTFHARSLLGAALLHQQKYAEAEPHLVQGYQGMKARTAKIPPVDSEVLPQATRRIVQLYEAWGKVDEADRWRTNLVNEHATHKP